MAKNKEKKPLKKKAVETASEATPAEAPVEAAPAEETPKAPEAKVSEAPVVVNEKLTTKIARDSGIFRIGKEQILLEKGKPIQLTDNQLDALKHKVQ